MAQMKPVSAGQHVRLSRHPDLIGHPELRDDVYRIVEIRMDGATEFAVLEPLENGKYRYVPTITLDVEFEYLRQELLRLAETEL
jgi:hypothetical protein